MRRKWIVITMICLFGAATVFTLSSCGSTNSGPSVGVFRTVTVIPSVLIPLLPVSLFTGATCTDNVLSGTVTVVTTPLQVSLVSTVYPQFTVGQPGTGGQPVTVTTYTIHYTPTNGGPPLQDVSGGVGVLVPPGGTAPATINLVDATDIGMLQRDPMLSQCSLFSGYRYTAQINFTGIEEGGTTAVFSTYTDVLFNNAI